MSCRLVVVVAVTLCFVESSSAQAVWSKRSTQAEPAGGIDIALAYDAKNSKVVAFGTASRGQTWVWNGVLWKLAATTGPSTGWSYKMVYDTENARILLLSSSSETWAWDGSKWTQLTTQTVPPVRGMFGLAYDSKRKVTVLFGGRGNGDLADTWEFDGTDWLQRSTGGPFPRIGMEMVYDEARGEVVLFGGERDNPSARLNDTWVWDGRVWLEHFGIPGPAKRNYAAMAYDSKRGLVVLSGGTDRTGTFYDDTWEWNGKAWTQINPTTRPTRDRYFGAMAYDPVREVTVLLHGDNSGSETWEYTNKPLPSATYASFGAGCAGSAGIPLLAAGPGQLPRLGQSFDVELSKLPNVSFVRAFGLIGVSNTNWMNASLPLNLGFVGMSGCNLLVSMDFMQNLTIVNNKATWSFQIPNNPALAGGLFFLQGLVFEPGVNTLGAIVSNGGAGKMGL